MSTEIKKCPSCGSEGIFFNRPDRHMYVVCSNDYCTMSGPSESKETSADKWNALPRREGALVTGMDPPKCETRELAKELRKRCKWGEEDGCPSECEVLDVCGEGSIHSWSFPCPHCNGTGKENL